MSFLPAIRKREREGEKEGERERENPATRLQRLWECRRAASGTLWYFLDPQRFSIITKHGMNLKRAIFTK